jgi:hypothetical protein
VKPYPAVLGEAETLQAVLEGRSLARYGDGEFNLCRDRSIPCQRGHAVLSSRLRAILRTPHENCLVGIPNLNSPTPKAPFWETYRYPLWTGLLSESVQYASAFVSRPDSAPWIDAREYWASVEDLWRGRAVTLVRGAFINGPRSLTADDLVGAAAVREIIGPRINAWDDYDELLELIGTPERAILCLGPTATVLAVDLCARGVHAIDIGHIGMFLRKHRRGEPMAMTSDEKRAV